MIKTIFLLIIIFYTNSFSYELKLDSSDRLAIDKSPKKSAILKRIKAYDEFKVKIKNLPIDKKLEQVNFFINQTLPEFDTYSIGIDDYWMTLKEFLIKGYGDCEDYAIAKYFTLLQSGVKKKNLYFAVVEVKGSLGLHMVLLYLENKNSSALVLDNLSFRVLPFSKREDLIPKVAFNEFDSYLFTSKEFTKKVEIDWQNDNKWRELLNRVYKLNR